MRQPSLPLGTQRRFYCGILLAVIVLVPHLARCETAVFSNVEPTVAEVRSLLEIGVQMEQQRRWAEALTHYEDALRDFPNHPQIRKRLSLARAHYDVGRRYEDGSYLDSMTTITQSQALDVYSEVMRKIETHFVDTPTWQALLDHGTTHMEVALQKEEFLKQHSPRSNATQIQAFRRDLRAGMNSHVPQNRDHARQMVRWAARLAWQQLEIRPSIVIMEYACGATTALDQYSTFLTGDQLSDIYNQIEGNFVGLGIELKAQEGSLLIVDVIPGGPAQRADIEPNDRIVEVNGFSTRDISTDRAADMLKGEQGTFVDIVVEQPSQQLRQLRVRRERVEVPSVEDVHVVDDSYGIGYLKLTGFQKTTSRDIEAALWKLHGQGMRSLIIDLRGNPGGLLTESVEIADKFVDDGTIVSTKGRSRHEDIVYKAHRVGTWRVPLVVLIDEDSASASEIFAGAIRDHRRGTVVGQRSFGKGSVQGIFPLSITKAGIRLTTAKFFSPNGQRISLKGVNPNIPVHVAQKPSSTKLVSAVDPILQAGIRVARQHVANR